MPFPRDPAEDPRSFTQQSAQSHASLIFVNLDRIGRRDRRDAFRDLQACLQEADRSVIFDTVNREGLRRQAERIEHFMRKLALVGQIMNRHHGGGPGAAGIVQIGRCQSRLPIMGVHDIRHERGNGAPADFGRDPRKCCEAHAVVGPILAVRRRR